MPSKKPAAGQTTKKAPAKKAAKPAKAPVKKPPAKKPPAKKAAQPAKPAAAPKQPPVAVPPQPGAAAPVEKKRPKASDYVKRPSHTPAIFKPASKRPIQILFTMEDVRETLRKRAREDSAAAALMAAANKTNGSKVAGGTATPIEPFTGKSKHGAASLDEILGLSGGNNRPGNANVPRKFQKYHTLLIEMRNQVREELNLHSSDTLKRSQKDDAGDIAISVDAGTDNFDRDFALSLLSSEQDMLNEIEAAIQRIYKGTYGVCEVTGEPIKPERLEAVPFTRFSLEGQRQHESNARKRISRTGAFLTEASAETLSFGDDDGDN